MWSRPSWRVWRPAGMLAPGSAVVAPTTSRLLRRIVPLLSEDGRPLAGPRGRPSGSCSRPGHGERGLWPRAGVAEDVQAAVAVAGQDQPLAVGGLVDLDTPEVVAALVDEPADL